MDGGGRKWVEVELMESVTGLDVDAREKTSCGQMPSAPRGLQRSGGGTGRVQQERDAVKGGWEGHAQRWAVLVAQAFCKKYHRLGG